MKKLTVLLCTVLTASSVLAACGSNDNSTVNNAPDSGGNKAKSDKPFHITMVAEQSTQIPKEDNEIETKLQEYTGVDFSMQWIPGSAYDDKINVMIASQDLPEIMTIKYSPNYISYMKEGLFWEVGPLIKDYPNLAEVSPLHYENVSVDGKVYGVPLFRSLARSGVTFRKDWLEKLNLELPVTLDDWYNVVKAMGEGDPDGNGKKDSYGIMLDKIFADGPSSVVNLLAVSQGAPNQWGVEDGKVVPSFYSQTYFDVLTLFRKLYSENLINQDFAVIDDSSAGTTWDAGKLGIKVGTAGIAVALQGTVAKTVPTAVVDVEPLQGADGKRAPAELGNNGLLVFPKSSVKTEEDLKKILGFLNKLLDEPMATLLQYGIEGKHWKNTDGNATVIDEDLFRLEGKPYRDRLLAINPGGKSIPKDMSDLERKTLDITVDNLNYAVGNPAVSLSSETYSQKGAELNIIMLDAQVKYIMGNIDEEGWKKEIANWEKAGGLKIIEEYTEQYNLIKE
ncbi:extracellular solute-binding protein [Paenibacillus agaridevorans]|uniref:extracellular solute-binding protein n=1 Tax=Paenibacillus agaridevorans TaxID=171404 RepID=UPI001BE40AF6|nr:extracellular solute-binding protein [Paenibacillus agaridevorans]